MTTKEGIRIVVDASDGRITLSVSETDNPALDASASLSVLEAAMLRDELNIAIGTGAHQRRQILLHERTEQEKELKALGAEVT